MSYPSTIDQLIAEAPDVCIAPVGDLIPISEKDGIPSVNARDLHLFLEVGKDFTNWIKARISSYDFQEGEDFTPVLAKSTGGRPSTEYTISLEMAKELSMVERNEKGKQARKYFIECEKQAHASPFRLPQTFSEALRALADTTEERQALLLENEQLKPDAHFGRALKDSSSNYTATQLAKELGLRSAQQLNAFLKNRGVIYYQSGSWKPYAQYAERGYFTYSSVIIPRGDATYTKENIKFTADGRSFVHKLLRKFQKGQAGKEVSS